MASWNPFWASWGPPGAPLGLLGAESSNFRFVVPVWSLSWAPLGALLGCLEAFLGRLEALLSRLGALLFFGGASWGDVRRLRSRLGRCERLEPRG